MVKNKLIFYAIWIILMSLGPISVFLNTDFSLLSGNRVLLTNFFQRVFGVTAFSMLFIQIVLGSYMHRWTDRLGGWIFEFHKTEGIFAYTILFLHPLTFVLFNYFYGRGFDPFYVFTQVCVLCNPVTEYYYTVGRIGFWLTTIAVTAALFRNASPFMRLQWRKFHVLNYITFLLVGIHGLLVGTDFMTMPFFAFAIVAYLIVLYIVIFKKLPQLVQNLRHWLT